MKNLTPEELNNLLATLLVKLGVTSAFVTLEDVKNADQSLVIVEQINDNLMISITK